jgi:hypothetical protein
LISCESLCLLKILAKDRMACKKASLVSTFLRKLVRTLAWISRRHKLSQLIHLFCLISVRLAFDNTSFRFFTFCRSLCLIFIIYISLDFCSMFRLDFSPRFFTSIFRLDFSPRFFASFFRLVFSPRFFASMFASICTLISVI